MLSLKQLPSARCAARPVRPVRRMVAAQASARPSKRSGNLKRGVSPCQLV